MANGPLYADPYGFDGGSAVTPPGGTSAGVAGGTSTEFMVWVLVVGILLPVLIIGGLQVGGFHFVFKR